LILDTAVIFELTGLAVLTQHMLRQAVEAK